MCRFLSNPRPLAGHGARGWCSRHCWGGGGPDRGCQSLGEGWSTPAQTVRHHCGCGARSATRCVTGKTLRGARCGPLRRWVLRAGKGPQWRLALDATPGARLHVGAPLVSAAVRVPSPGRSAAMSPAPRGCACASRGPHPKWTASCWPSWPYAGLLCRRCPVGVAPCGASMRGDFRPAPPARTARSQLAVPSRDTLGGTPPPNSPSGAGAPPAGLLGSWGPLPPRLLTVCAPSQRAGVVWPRAGSNRRATVSNARAGRAGPPYPARRAAPGAGVGRGHAFCGSGRGAAEIRSRAHAARVTDALTAPHGVSGERPAARVQYLPSRCITIWSPARHAPCRGPFSHSLARVPGLRAPSVW